jgi:hypothetical protein
MEISNELLEKITTVAGSAYPPRQVAFILGLKPSLFETLVRDEDSDVSIAYYKGLFSSEFAVRQSIITLATTGSSPAQTTANKLFDETRRELTRGAFPGFDAD